MQVATWIGKHGEAIKLLLILQFGDLKTVVVLPV
jgi:hypothetical protein